MQLHQQMHVQIRDSPGDHREAPDATDRRPTDPAIRPVATHNAPASENAPTSTHWLMGALPPCGWSPIEDHLCSLAEMREDPYMPTSACRALAMLCAREAELLFEVSVKETLTDTPSGTRHKSRSS